LQALLILAKEAHEHPEYYGGSNPFSPSPDPFWPEKGRQKKVEGRKIRLESRLERLEWAPVGEEKQGFPPAPRDPGRQSSRQSSARCQKWPAARETRVI